MTNQSNVLVAHPGTQHAFRLAVELHRGNSLSRFATGLAIADRSILGRATRLMPACLTRKWSKRSIPLVPSGSIHTFPALELSTMWRVHRGESSQEVLHDRNAVFQKAIPDGWIEEATHVVGFDTSSWVLAQRAKALGRPFILDQSIGHPRTLERICGDLRNRFPDWAGTIPKKPDLHLRCEDIEHEFSSIIVAPSTFVGKTLAENGVPTNKVYVIPFGADLDVFHPGNAEVSPPIIFIYVGALTARKGVPVLLEAWKQAALNNRAELWLAGPGTLPSSTVLPTGVRLLGLLSRGELADAMRKAHVFVFPSFFEGLALVQLEALASGLPVIGTFSSGAADIIVPDETGLIVTAGRVDELSDSLSQMTNVDKVRTMRQYCIATRDGRSWAQYGNRWMQLLAGTSPEQSLELSVSAF